MLATRRIQWLLWSGVLLLLISTISWQRNLAFWNLNHSVAQDRLRHIPQISTVEMNRLYSVLEASDIRMPDSYSDRTATLIAWGDKYVLDQEYETAIRFFDAATLEQPELVDAPFFAGFYLERIDADQEALLRYEEAFSRSVFGQVTYADVGVVYSQLKATQAQPTDWASVLPIVEEVLQNLEFEQLSRGESRAYVALGRGLEASADFDGAIKAYEQALRYQPTLYWPRIYIAGLLLEEKQQFGSAETLLLEAVGLRPDEPLAYVRLAEIYLETDRKLQALEYLESVLTFAPDDGRANSLFDSLIESE